MERDKASLFDIVGAARTILHLVDGFDRATFLSDRRTHLAVLHQFIVLGEAVKRLSLEFRAQHADVPWREIAGMRDKLVHDYDDVNLNRVWGAVQRDVPALLAEVERLLRGTENGGG